MNFGNRLDLCIDQGATFTQQLTIKADDGNNIVGIETSDLRGQIRTDYDSSTVAGSFTFAWVDHAEGVADMTLSATVSAAIAGGNYVYDVELALANGTVYRIMEGRVKVRPEVTR